MCGRAYETFSEEELYLRFLNKRRIKLPLDIKPNYNLAPTQVAPIIYEEEGERKIEFMRWGLVPAWAKDVKSASHYSLINARSEEISEKRSYKEAFKKRRCVVPLSGFFEWYRPESGPKRPFAIHLKTDEIMGVAGVWENWESKLTTEKVKSFAIITTEANSVMKKVHNRMPVILNKDDETFWLNPDNEDVEGLKKLLKPCPSSWLETFEVSTLVNSPRHNEKNVLTPV